MGSVDFGFLCDINRPRGLSDRTSVSSPTLHGSHSYALSSELAQSTGSAIRDQVPGRQTGSGGNLFPTTVTRVLQPHLLGAQEGWRVQTGVQFEAPEQVCRQGEVQNRALCRIKNLPVTHVLVYTWMLTVKSVYELSDVSDDLKCTIYTHFQGITNNMVLGDLFSCLISLPVHNCFTSLIGWTVLCIKLWWTPLLHR